MMHIRPFQPDAEPARFRRAAGRASRLPGRGALTCTVMLLIAAMLLGLPVRAYSGITVNVPSQYSTIQDAVDNLPDGVAGDPNVVQLAQGNHKEHDVEINGRNYLTIRGGTDLSDAVNYTIDAEGLGRGFVVYNGSQGISLEGLNITNGRGTDYGVYNPWNSGESSTAGGGNVIVDGSNLTISYSILTNGVAEWFIAPGGKDADGGAIHFMNNSTGSVEDSIISDNTATHSVGGIAVHRSNVNIKRNEILRNTGEDSTSGGGIGFFSVSSGEVSNNRIAYNRAWRVSYGPQGGGGAGINNFNSSPIITNNVIEYNSTQYPGNGDVGLRGGGINVTGLPLPLIRNNVIRENFSSANQEDLSTFNLPFLVTFDNNNIKNWATVKAWMNTTYGTTFTDKGNIDADPMFDVDGISLLLGSPNIDSGTSNGAPSIDYFGNPRPSGSGYDIGAHEYQFPTPTPTATPTSTATPTPTDTPTPEPPTPTPTNTLTPTPTNTPVPPTATPTPTNSPTPIPTDTPTQPPAAVAEWEVF